MIQRSTPSYRRPQWSLGTDPTLRCTSRGTRVGCTHERARQPVWVSNPSPRATDRRSPWHWAGVQDRAPCGAMGDLGVHPAWRLQIPTTLMSRCGPRPALPLKGRSEGPEHPPQGRTASHCRVNQIYPSALSGVPHLFYRKCLFIWLLCRSKAARRRHARHPLTCPTGPSAPWSRE